VTDLRLTVSIIIPTLNEARRIADVVRHALSLGDVEVVVADGGSTDGTPALALDAGARVVNAPLGRGAQLDAGAAAASGDVLLFLHADTHLPEDAVDHVRAALTDPEVVGGNFFLRYVPYTRVGMALTAYNHLRRTLLHHYAGASGLFVRRRTFAAIGGFGPMPILEDRIFVQKLERSGRTRHLPTWAETSSRRFLGREWRAAGTWALIRTLKAAGVPLPVLARLYEQIRD
jgi:glycosyltransferase involved in cell wall biosynthesis